MSLAALGLVAGLAVAGAVLGVVVNRMIERLPAEAVRFWTCRTCPRCGSALGPPIPIVTSSVCRACRARLDPTAARVELAMAAGFAATGLLAALGLGRTGGGDPALLAVGLLLVAHGLAVSVIDARYLIIPDELTTWAVPVALGLSALAPGIHRPLPLAGLDDPVLAGLAASAAGALTGGGLLYLIVVAGSRLMGREAMGLGDAKLFAAQGALLGWQDSLVAFLVAIAAGLLIGGATWAATGSRKAPFGPSLVLGTLVAFHFGGPIVDLWWRASLP